MRDCFSRLPHGPWLRRWRRAYFLWALLCLPGCFETQPGILVPKPLGLNAFDGRQGGTQRLRPPEIGRFSICHGHTCRYVVETGFSAEEWQDITAASAAGAASGARERAMLPGLIGLMETMVGAKTGTAGDLAENHSRLAESGQMDCIDESSNTLTYLTLLTNARLLRWHRVGARLNRGPYTLVLQAPHSAAEMVELDSGDRYAVDSWFGANGEPALVVTATDWATGYRPAMKPAVAEPNRYERRARNERPTGW